jgi:hypothetical protein
MNGGRNPVKPRIEPLTFTFDYGIEAILRDVEHDDPLPAADVGPAFSPLKPRLDQLYALPNIEDYLYAELAPVIAESAMLLPYRFWQSVSSARMRLAADSAREPRHSRTLNRAAAVLDDQRGMFALLQDYRLALVQG